jgi:hypothetical protein
MVRFLQPYRRLEMARLAAMPLEDCRLRPARYCRGCMSWSIKRIESGNRSSRDGDAPQLLGT